IAACADVAHCESIVVNETVTRIETAVGIDAQIRRAGPTRVRTMRAAMNFVQCGLEITERMTLAGEDSALCCASAREHVVAKLFEIGGCKCKARIRRDKHGRESDRIESERNEVIENRLERIGSGRHCGSR